MLFRSLDCIESMSSFRQLPVPLLRDCLHIRLKCAKTVGEVIPQALRARVVELASPATIKGDYQVAGTR